MMTKSVLRLVRRGVRMNALTPWTRMFSEAAAASESSSVGPKSSKRNMQPALSKAAKQNINIHNAIDLVQQHAWAKFDESIEISVNLSVDPRKPNQSIKAVAKLPRGTGKTVRVAVLASGQDASDAVEGGADLVGAEDLIEKIQNGDLSFNTLIATPEMMPMLGKVGRILGPRGLMPNPKLGTVTKDIKNAIVNAKEGSVQFRVEKKGIVQAGIGKVSFTKEALIENIRAFMLAVSDAKPENFKGKYMKSAALCSTMGPGIHLDLASVDPSNGKFMLSVEELKA
jgi:large subunit ribosomal protein L1